MNESKTIVIILINRTIFEYDNVTVSMSGGSFTLGEFLYIVSNDKAYFIPYDTIDTITLKY